MKSLVLPQPFQPDEQEYQESMIFLAVLPFVYLIFVMVLLMIFYCCVDFTTSHEGDHKKSCCNWSASFYTVSRELFLNSKNLDSTDSSHAILIIFDRKVVHS